MTDTALTLEARHEGRLRLAFEEEELLGLRLAMKLRLVALVVISGWLLVQSPWPGVIFYLAFMPAFALLGAAPVALRRAGLWGPRLRYVAPTLDIALLTFVLFAANPLEPEWFPVAMKLHFANEVYYYVLLAAALLYYSPRMVLWCGVTAALAWTLAAVWVLTQPGSYVAGGIHFERLGLAERLALLADPHRVDPGWVGNHVVVLIVVSGILAAVVWRTRHLVLSQAAAERERSNLRRYFSPNMVDDLARQDEPLREVRTQQVAVLFVDIAGFTRMCEDQPPEAVIVLLRDFHARMEAQVFAHHGTLDKYLGDGLMATFGTPWPGPGDAANALACARAMVASIETWNRERRAAGRPDIRIGVGLHYGQVVLGDVGGAHRLEFAVICDTVNVASRLERLTRDLGVAVVASDDLIDAARRQAGEDDDRLAGLAEAPGQTIRGREGRLTVWTLGQAGAGEGHVP